MTDQQPMTAETKFVEWLIARVSEHPAHGGSTARNRDHERYAAELDEILQQIAKERFVPERAHAIFLGTLNGATLASTARPSRSARTVKLRTALVSSICEGIACDIADYLLTYVDSAFNSQQRKMIHDAIAYLLLEYLPFERPLEQVFKTTPRLVEIRDLLRISDQGSSDQEMREQVRAYCSRRARIYRRKITDRRSAHRALLASLEQPQKQGPGNGDHEWIWKFIDRVLHLIAILLESPEPG